MVTDEQRAIDLRSQIITKEQALSRLKVPKPTHVKIELRKGMMGRVQRRENLRFRKQIEKQKISYKKQREAIDKYIQQLETYEQPLGETEFGIQTQTATVAPLPKVSFFGTPRLKKARGRFKKQILRGRKR